MNYHESPLFTSKSLRSTSHTQSARDGSQNKTQSPGFTSAFEKHLNANLRSFPDPEATGGVGQTTTFNDRPNLFKRMSKRNKFILVGVIIFAIISIIIGIGVAANNSSQHSTLIPSTNQTGFLPVPGSEMLTTGVVPRVTSAFEYPLPTAEIDSTSFMASSPEATATSIDGQSTVTATQTATTMVTQQTMSIETIIVSVTVGNSLDSSLPATSVQSSTQPTSTTVDSSSSPASTLSTQETATTLITSVESSQAPSTASAQTPPTKTADVAQPTASSSGDITFCGAPGTSCNFRRSQVDARSKV